MHHTSFEKMLKFHEVYLGPYMDTPLRILDVGSQLVEEGQGTYRGLFDRPDWRYDGLDVSAGLNVDIAVADPYDWVEIADDTYDLVISGQALEHVEFFWGTAFEIGRVLKPGGVTALIAPSNGFEHRYPVDCWRFYADGMRSLAKYLGFEVVDVFTDWGRDVWQDSILVMRKPQWTASERQRFAERAAMQRALLECETRPVPTAGEGPTPSPLAAIEAGRLSPVLEQIRTEALASPASATSTHSVVSPPAGWRRLLRR
ncbi:MAG: class I SAM-dependent methyltransferase [Actinomycetota bacterium]